MQIKTLASAPPISLHTLNLRRRFKYSAPFTPNAKLPFFLLTPRVHLPWKLPVALTPRRNCVAEDGYSETIDSLVKEEEGKEAEVKKEEGLENRSMWNQIKEIVMFTGPATGIWLCGPLMSIIDTAVIGQGSSIELAALGPGTVLCDYMCYVFMFLSIATSNLVATSLAKKDTEEVQHQISVLLFVGLVCGFLMLLFTRFFGARALTAFTGSRNAHIVPAANTYVQIRCLALPAVFIGWVAQSARWNHNMGSLSMLCLAHDLHGVTQSAFAP